MYASQGRTSMANMAMHDAQSHARLANNLQASQNMRDIRDAARVQEELNK